MRCKICGRQTEKKWCVLHEESYSNLMKGYDTWKEASKITWGEYLKKILGIPSTGIWIKEIIGSILNSENNPD